MAARLPWLWRLRVRDIIDYFRCSLRCFSHWTCLLLSESECSGSWCTSAVLFCIQTHSILSTLVHLDSFYTITNAREWTQYDSPKYLFFIIMVLLLCIFFLSLNVHWGDICHMSSSLIDMHRLLYFMNNCGVSAEFIFTGNTPQLQCSHHLLQIRFSITACFLVHITAFTLPIFHPNHTVSY